MNMELTCDQLKKRLDQLRPFPPETLKSLREYYRIGLTYSSNALEGNSLTESETKVVLEDGLTVNGRPLHDINEALGHAEAYDFLQNMATDKPFELPDILKLHQLFYKRIEPEKAGVFRKVQVFISGSHHPLPSPAQIPVLMDRFVTWYQENETKLHPVELAALTHQKFVFIHPFVDGNGRVARLLMNFVLMRFGYPVTIIPPILRMEYIEDLEKAHTNTRDFVEFIFGREIETLRELLRLLDTDGVTSPFDGENDGVNQVLVLLREHPGWRVPMLLKMMNKSRPTVERYLHQLREQGKIEFRGAPKNGGYFVK